jgi:surface antigen
LKAIFALALGVLLAACNVETMGTAATGAALKKQELEQGKQTMQRAQERIDVAVQQMNAAAAKRGDDGIK